MTKHSVCTHENVEYRGGGITANEYNLGFLSFKIKTTQGFIGTVSKMICEIVRGNYLMVT